MRDNIENPKVTVSESRRAERIAVVCILSALAAALFFGLTDLAIPPEVVCLLIYLFGPACVVAFVGWIAVASLPTTENVRGKPGPSVVVWSLIGLATGALIAVILLWWLATPGTISIEAAYNFNLWLGGTGALAGYEAATKRARALGAVRPEDEWENFYFSRRFSLIMLVMLIGSGLLACATGLIHHAVRS